MNYTEALDKAKEIILEKAGCPKDDSPLSFWMPFFGLVVSQLNIFVSIFNNEHISTLSIIPRFQLILVLSVIWILYKWFKYRQRKVLYPEVTEGLYKIIQLQSQPSNRNFILLPCTIKSKFCGCVQRHLRDSTLYELQLILASIDDNKSIPFNS